MGLETYKLIAIILWITLSIIAAMDYIPYAKELKGLKLIVFFAVFAIGGPVFGINEILTTLLESIMPEGWDDKDGDGDGKDDFYKRY